MQLRSARLCLNCEEVHGNQQCPACASESFAYLTRWVPVSDRRPGVRSPPATIPEDTKGSSSLRWARRGVAGVAVVAVTQWLWRHSRPVEWTESGAGTDADGDAARADPPDTLVQ